MSTDDWWNNIGRLMPKYSEKTLSDCYFHHQGSHTDWPEIESRPSSWWPFVIRIAYARKENYKWFPTWIQVTRRDSIVGITTRYVLNGLQIESRMGISGTSSPIQGYRVSFLGMAFANHPHFWQTLKKEYSYTSTFPLAFMDCSRVKFTFILS
jgi:hypothetical protein